MTFPLRPGILAEVALGSGGASLASEAGLPDRTLPDRTT